MKPHRLGAPQALPQTRNDLQLWVREHLELPSDLEAALLEAVDAVFSRHERLWQESKQEAIQALAAAFSRAKATLVSLISIPATRSKAGAQARANKPLPQ